MQQLLQRSQNIHLSEETGMMLPSRVPYSCESEGLLPEQYCPNNNLSMQMHKIPGGGGGQTKGTKLQQLAYCAPTC